MICTCNTMWSCKATGQDRKRFIFAKPANLGKLYIWVEGELVL